MKRLFIFLGFFLIGYFIFSQNCDDLKMRSCLRQTYMTQVDVAEATGHNDGIDVEKYLASAGRYKGEPWCASFIYWCYKQCGITVNISLPGYVPAYAKELKVVYQKDKNKMSECNPRFGDVVTFYNSELGRPAHIGFYDGQNGDFIFTVEGNTNSDGSREGNKVCMKRRLKRTIYTINTFN